MQPLSEVEQRFLLHVARSAIEGQIVGKGSSPAQKEASWPAPGKIPAALESRAGAFVTLRKAGLLRGCIGRPEGVSPLYRTVRECALSAALEDPRFGPVQPEEVPFLTIEISVLSPLAEVRAEEVEVGRHGLVVSLGSRRGLLLPQVASEMGWNRNRFLEETCLKAGLPKDAWKHGARLHVFTAQIFRESEARLSPRKVTVQGEVNLENVHPRLAQKAKLAAFDVMPDEAS
ncbi:MAG: AmmeMemoRadiSam system protein A [Terriglobia bacterium]